MEDFNGYTVKKKNNKKKTLATISWTFQLSTQSNWSLSQHENKTSPRCLLLTSLQDMPFATHTENKKNPQYYSVLHTQPSVPQTALASIQMQINVKPRQYELLLLGLPGASVRVRVDTNPLLELPGIYSQSHLKQTCLHAGVINRVGFFCRCQSHDVTAVSKSSLCW